MPQGQVPARRLLCSGETPRCCRNQDAARTPLALERDRWRLLLERGRAPLAW